MNIVESQDNLIPKTSIKQPFKMFNIISVNFRYSKEANWVLKDISMNIKSGDSIGIVGKSDISFDIFDALIFQV